MSNTSFTDPERFPTWMEMTPMKRVARPDKIASAILFLASEASSAITGTTLVVALEASDLLMLYPSTSSTQPSSRS